MTAKGQVYIWAVLLSCLGIGMISYKHLAMGVRKGGKVVIGVACAYILQFNDFCQSSNACIADRFYMDGADQKDLSHPNMRF